MISGKIIGLRAVEKEDLPLFRDWRNIPEFRRNFREVRELSLSDQECWFDSLQRTKHINYMFTVVDLKTNEAIGAVGLLYINWQIRSADFSFYIGADKKYVSDDAYSKEAAKLLIEYGFNNLNLNKIWMELYEFDCKKINFFENLFGFKEDGVLRQNCFEDGRYWDSKIISLLKSEVKM
ncbi:GNAT family N-acetyltransferase [Labilibaculum sp. DW002]|uniref:GNAT family N-acetyltransferase n=1 Tax=Paralabilibaculum antarcticum TaxID=2912572 RepID=A0ABT5VPM0_9BACT|nr:GNAT family protein [Labilibaculum sp. DW002]MDE5417227.1 GNAT family N-acetyltransferase [Labilibaculum sp. DW002]